MLLEVLEIALQHHLDEAHVLLNIHYCTTWVHDTRSNLATYGCFFSTFHTASLTAPVPMPCTTKSTDWEARFASALSNSCKDSSNRQPHKSKVMLEVCTATLYLGSTAGISGCLD